MRDNFTCKTKTFLKVFLKWTSFVVTHVKDRQDRDGCYLKYNVQKMEWFLTVQRRWLRLFPNKKYNTSSNSSFKERLITKQMRICLKETWWKDNGIMRFVSSSAFYILSIITIRAGYIYICMCLYQPSSVYFCTPGRYIPL